MYESYFGFREKPFSIAPDPRFMYPSPAHEEALGHLVYGVSEPGGFVLLTGEVGTGKTTLIRTLLERLPENMDVALILNPKLTPTEFVAAVCDELAVAYERPETLKTLVDALNRHLLETFAAGHRTVLVVDEAQALSPDVLEQIRLLTNLETTREKLLEIILVGQPELRATLARNELRQLAQRITARYHLSPLEREDVRRYVAHRIGVVGGDVRLFSSRALVALARLSGGVPRLINEIADRALLGAYAAERESVEAPLIRRAAAEVTGEPEPAPRTGLASLAVISLSAVVLGSAVWWLQNERPEWFAPFVADTSRQKAPGQPLPPVVVTIQAPESSAEAGGTVAEPDAAKSAVQAAKGPATGGEAFSGAPPAGDEPLLTEANVSEGAETGRKPEFLTPTGPGSASALPGSERAAAEPAVSAWLDANRESLSFGEAMSELFRVWGVSSEGESGNLCQAEGWSCLFRQGNWQTLSALDLPVALRLSNEAGDAFFVALTGLTRKNGIVRAGGEEQSFPRWALEARWTGEFAVAWSPPNDWDVPVNPGERGSKNVIWARQQLARLFARPLTGMGPADVYDPRLEEAVRLFQTVNGVGADGVLDTETLLHIYAVDVSRQRPRLWRED